MGKCAIIFISFVIFSDLQYDILVKSLLDFFLNVTVKRVKKYPIFSGHFLKM